MAEDKKKILIYSDWIGTFEKLTDDEAGKLIKHLFRYVNDLNPDSPDRLIEIVFEPIKQQLKRDLIKWEAKAGKNRENGALGGRPKKTENNPENPDGFFKTQVNPKKPVTVNVTVTDTVNDILLKKETKDISMTKQILFDSFWKQYDKKMDREKCLKKWLSLSMAEINECLEKISDYVKSTPDKQFRKHPTTYLNGKHWNDEIIIKQQNNGITNNSKPSESLEQQARRIAEATFGNGTVQSSPGSNASDEECDFEVVN